VGSEETEANDLYCSSKDDLLTNFCLLVFQEIEQISKKMKKIHCRSSTENA